MHRILASVTLLSLLSSTALADEALSGRAEMNWRYGQDRSTLMNELWVPIVQGAAGRNVLYGDLRLMGDDGDNREGNLGIGYRQITALPLLGEGVAGAHGWIDRRLTERGSTFHQITLGGEWRGRDWDILANAYVPLSGEKEYEISNLDAHGPALVGTGIVVSTNATVLEEPQDGFDLELGWNVPFLQNYTDSFRLYGGGYYFDGDHTARVAGWRTRLAADITPDFQLGARFQKDDERGSQGFLEATIRFPFGQKKSYRRDGLKARLDESPERDIDIVTGGVTVDPGKQVPVVNRETGQVQTVLHVDNTTASGGNGSAERPFSTLAAAQAAAGVSAIIYVHSGDGTVAGQNAGITLTGAGQQLIGQGVDFIYDTGRFTTQNGKALLGGSLVIAKAGTAPVITNGGGDGISITADNVTVTGVTVDGAGRDGIEVSGNNAAVYSVVSKNNTRHGIYTLNVANPVLSNISATGNTEDGIRLEASGVDHTLSNALLSNVTATGNKNGIRFYAQDDGGVSGALTGSLLSANSQHGVIVYDDSVAGSVNADLGGGTLGSLGLNILSGNTLEDLALDIDGAVLSAQNNWWGQASGEYQAVPSGALKPQIYYGAPIDDELAGHWTFDSEWTTNTTAYNRVATIDNGTLSGGLVITDLVAGKNGEAFNFDGAGSAVTVPTITNGASFMQGAGLFGVTLWFRTTDSSGVIFGQREQGVNVDGTKIYMDNNKLCMKILAPGQTVCTAADYNDGQWHHVALVRPLTNSMDSFIDGVSQPRFSGGGNSLDAPLGFKIGADYEADAGILNYIDGDVDDVMLYNQPFGVDLVTTIYNMNTTSVVNTGSYLTTSPQ